MDYGLSRSGIRKLKDNNIQDFNNNIISLQGSIYIIQSTRKEAILPDLRMSAAPAAHNTLQQQPSCGPCSIPTGHYNKHSTTSGPYLAANGQTNQQTPSCSPCWASAGQTTVTHLPSTGHTPSCGPCLITTNHNKQHSPSSGPCQTNQHTGKALPLINIRNNEILMPGDSTTLQVNLPD